MFERLLTVSYTDEKCCFCCVSADIKNLKNGTNVKLLYGRDKVAYFSVTNATTSLEINTIGISALYAKALGIAENEVVSVAELSQLSTIKTLSIAPINNNDYEILEMFAENVQSTLLDQIRVVNSGQNIVIWVGNNIHIKVIVDDVKPISPGCIDVLTEVVIKTAAEANEEAQGGVEQYCNEKKITSIKDFLKFMGKKDNNTNKSLRKEGDIKQSLIYRLIPVNELPFLEKISNYRQPFNVFTRKSNLDAHWINLDSFTQPIICSLSILSTDIFPGKTVYVRLCFFEDFMPNFAPNLLEQNLFVNDLLFNHLECELSSRVVLQFVQKPSYVSEIQIFMKKNYLINVEEEFKIFLADNSSRNLLLNCDVLINLGKNLNCLLKFVPSEAKFCMVDDDFVRNCKYSVHEEQLPLVAKNLNKNPVDYAMNFSNYPKIIQDVLFNYSYQNNWTAENFLVTGKQGTGKTKLLKVIVEKLKSYPYYIYTEVISCKNIKGKTSDSLYKIFTTAFSKLVLHQPSCLILDDLHVICENVKGDDLAPNAVYFDRISELLHNFLTFVSKSNMIGILATSESTAKLNQNMYSSRGSHLFKNVCCLEDLKKLDRKQLLEYFFKNLTLNDVDLDQLSEKTEGFVIEDLINLVNKTAFEALKDEEDFLEDSESKICSKHCDRALKNTCILSLNDVQLHSPGSKDFSDVGGLHDVKKILVESLLWPVKYSSVFAEAPLRLQSGLLLYGPPGTGKTLLAGAAARHCGLRLISIKGPELLSKYIGASEQAVRDIFQKAQSARPCILFFDEFDSLAPRRGHDNTGVTDRVVNQLLTQLDGVESLAGVCLLAATSRPDLLDPALLRPGRLDKQLLCPLPDLDARIETLKVLSKALDLAHDVDLEQVAMGAEGFSGADLQSILYTAQVSSVDLLDDMNGPLNSKITQVQLVEALGKTRPSLTRQERRKYERIYTKFEGGGSIDDFKSGSKATLA